MKLKKLILSGFKSFADRTEFDFDDGISCVVGPNGCGKSNIVDAIKWVLGEQSAKSLRGSEMMDVIFNGSSSRRPSGSAQVTLVFDNSGGMLQLSGMESETNQDVISVSRRLFRSGQSDYLINNTVCRLRDVREMFMDTGIGHDTYSVIEQGRVEAFLQASQDERRAIFDEAAGISKYKARKKEAIRKLERVEQNMLRLDDILGEVEKRLRSIKYQAAKARNYQTYSEQLNELKSLHYLAQYHNLLLKRQDLQGKLSSNSDLLASLNTRIEQLKSARNGAEFESSELERAATDLQSQSAAIELQINSCRQRAEMLTDKVSELADRIEASCRKKTGLETEIATGRNETESTGKQLAHIDENSAQLTAQTEKIERDHTQSRQVITELTAKLEDEKSGLIDLLRRVAQLHNDLNASSIRRENLGNRQTAMNDKAKQIADELQGLLTEQLKVETKLAEVTAVLTDTRSRLEQAGENTDKLSAGKKRLSEALTIAREQRSATAGRIEALRETLSSFEGVGSGTRRVLEAKRNGKLQAIRGMLGQFIRTDTEHAPIVEAALAGADQQLIAMSFDDIQNSLAELNELLGDGGGVEITAMDCLEAWHHDVDARAFKQVIGRVIDWVSFEPWLAPVMWRLLGRTFVVPTLEDAMCVSKATSSGLRFVTLTGQVLETDRSVRIGSPSHSAGVIGRQSELAELDSKISSMDRRIERLDAKLKDVSGRYEHSEQTARTLRTAIYESNTERLECDGELGRVREQIETLKQQEPLVAADLADLKDRIDGAIQAERVAGEKAAELEQHNAQRNEHVGQIEQRIDAARREQDELAGKLTEIKVARAQSDEKKLSLTHKLRDLTERTEQLQRDQASLDEEIQTDRISRTEAEKAIETANADSKRLRQQMDSLSAQADQSSQARQSLRQRVEQIRRELDRQQEQNEKLAEQVNTSKVAQAQVDTHVENLIARAGEDMNMDLLKMFTAYQHDEQRDWDETERQIDELRQKVQRLGNVNLDAIEEQEELENRGKFLSGQLDDIKESRGKLDDLIQKINDDSHEKFLETFEIVRANFQELFRKLFGGGRADVLLIDPQNVLESGIEIVARPPGKELRSLSLLSGGEKTMTALALMFSMFKHRPGPFCLLDEVDAALDEANTERFSRLLAEFVEHSQFIVISHAKRTMSMSNVLYGVTMQTPGVSKRISVRFEDVEHKLDKQLEPVGA